MNHLHRTTGGSIAIQIVSQAMNQKEDGTEEDLGEYGMSMQTLNKLFAYSVKVASQLVAS
jgi:hypothetical protein